MARIQIHEFNEEDFLARLDSSVEKALRKALPTLTQVKASNSPELMSIKEAAAYLGLAVPTLYSKISKREISHSKTGKIIRFLKSDLDAFIQAGRRRTRKEIINQAKS